MLKLIYYENHLNKTVSFEQFTFIFSHFCNYVNSNGEIIEISDKNSVLFGLCDFYGKELITDINEQENVIDFLYIDKNNSEDLQDTLFFALNRLSNDGMICIKNEILSEECIVKLNNECFCIENKFGYVIVKHKELYLYNIADLIKEIENGASYYILGGGVGDILLSLSQLQEQQSVDLVICWPFVSHYPAKSYKFIEEQPYINSVKFVDFNELLSYVKQNGGEYHYDILHAQFMAFWFNERYNRKVFDPYYNACHLEVKPRMLNLNPLMSIKLPQKAINWASNIIKVLDVNKKINLILPYSWSSPKNTESWLKWKEMREFCPGRISSAKAWQGWHDLLTFLPNLVSDSNFVFVGLDWDSKPYNKPDNVLDLVDKIPNISCLFALAECANAIFSTINSMGIFCVGQQKNVYIFEINSRTEVWYHVLPREVIMPYEMTYNQFIKLKIGGIR